MSKRNLATGVLRAVAMALSAILLITTLAPQGAGQKKSSAKKGKQARETPSIGYDDTPFLPDGKWRVHDIRRPHPRIITPGTESNPERAGRPPSDAVVLFAGTDLSQWIALPKGGTLKDAVEPRWKVENGYMEVVEGTGHLASKQKFGDCQIHVEWATPAQVSGASQSRGNSGVMMMSRYEIQILDSYENVSYADGQAASIYGQYPPIVNASRKPGEWQSYDIVFEAPKFDGEKLVKPAYATVFHNGVLVHHRQAFIGRMRHRAVGTYAPHDPEEPLMLQNHGNPVRFRNVWVRRLKGYDEPC